jgi:hypothetical protein
MIEYGTNSIDPVVTEEPPCISVSKLKPRAFILYFTYPRRYIKIINHSPQFFVITKLLTCVVTYVSSDKI